MAASGCPSMPIRTVRSPLSTWAGRTAKRRLSTSSTVASSIWV
jgi:hypothetical protein